MTKETMDDRTLTDLLIDFATGFDLDAVDEGARNWGRRCILDLFGCILAASSPNFTVAPILEQFARSQGGNSECTLIGRRMKTSPMLAALVNGTMGYYCDNEPRYSRGILHALAVVCPAALAIGESYGATGRDLMSAVTVGVELAGRMSDAMSPRALYERGFHPTSVAGVYGSTAAAGYLIGLDRQQWRNALGLAAQQACGLLAWVSDHTEHSRPFNPGLASRNGVTAAILASMGFGGPPNPLGGKYDVFTAFSGHKDEQCLREELGSYFLIGEQAPKRHASVGFTHPGLDALIEVMTAEGLKIDDIASLDVHVAKSAGRVIDGNELKSHNAQYVFAIGALKGVVPVDDILGPRLDHPEVDRLSQHVTVVYDENLEKAYPRGYSSIVKVRTLDGREFSNQMDWPIGFRQNPMSDEEWTQKFMRMATRVASEAQAQRIVEMVLNLEQVADVRTLGDALSLAQ